MGEFFKPMRKILCLFWGLAIVCLSIGFAKAQVCQDASGNILPATPIVMPGCDPTTLNGIQQTHIYTAQQSYNVSYGLIQQPNGFSNCLQGMLNGAQSLLNLFDGSGGSLSSLISSLGQQLVTSLLQALEQQACTAIQSAIGGIGLGGGITGSVIGTSVTSLLGSGNASGGRSVFVSNYNLYPPMTQPPSSDPGDVALALQTNGFSISSTVSPAAIPGSAQQFGGPPPSRPLPPIPPCITVSRNLTASEGTDVPTPIPATDVHASAGTMTATGPAPGGGVLCSGYDKLPAAGHVGVNEECVSLTKYFCPGANEPTTNWKMGALVQGNSSIVRGTAIATFLGPGNSYIFHHSGPYPYWQHTGVYTGQEAACMSITEQWHGGGLGNAHNRCILWNGVGSNPYPWNQGRSYNILIP